MQKSGETDKVEVYIDDNGNKVYKCKFCGAWLHSKSELMQHFNVKNPDKLCPNYHPHKKQTQKIEEEEEEIALTPEEEMRREMLQVFQEKLSVSPGVEKKKIEWAVEYAKSSKVLFESPTELFRFLQRTFPKMDDMAIDFIVREVFKVKEQYTRRSSAYTYTPQMQQRSTYTYGMTYTQPIQPPQPQGSDVVSLMFSYMMQQQQMMQQQYQQMMQQYMQLLERKKTEKTEDEIREEVMKEVELKELKERISNQEKMLNELIQYIREGRIGGGVSPEGWKDDYARAVTELGTQITSALTQLRIEQSKTRRMIMQYVLAQQAGVSKPQGKGETEKEVIEELPEELVEKEGGGEE